MDPEVIFVGAHAKFAPIFLRDLSFRPNVNFGFGEVTKMLDVNLDAAYRLPLTQRWSSWSIYMATGPSLGFSQQNFGESGIDWDNLEFTPGLNIVSGLESRKGFFMEARATVWARPNPTFRLLFGYTF